VIRTLDGSFLTEVANHPEVRPWLGGEGFLDLRPAIATPENIALQFVGGGFVFHRIGEGLYEAHSLFLPAHRGSEAVRCLRAALRYMFTATDCMEILSRVPDGNLAADGFARLAGGREAYRLEHDPKFLGKPVSVRSLTLDMWREADDACWNEGIAYGALLEAAGEEAGDEDQENAIGAAVLMFKAGQHGKAVWSYNRWAAMSGYHQIELACVSPLIISTGKAFIAVLDGRIEVMKCQR
jgi:hypothetical protein